jgi:hypothetical protein
MSYKSKRTIASTVTGTVLLAAYLAYALEKHSSGQDGLDSWAMTMLAFIVIAVVALIAIQILFHIVYVIGISVRDRGCNDDNVERTLSSEMVEDEMDKLIGLKSARIGYVCVGIGFITALAAMAFDASAILALNVMFVSFAAGSLIEGGSSIYFYSRGVRNG